ncbi:MAG TPA: M15 family metallopeptidase [Candidatus Eisenbacteria bacterium]|nr:M15 family metallopeptidase [Candidatus Eisenbacteria bacterium]
MSLYAGEPGASCDAATYSLAWTDATSNRPASFPIVDLTAGRCAYLELTATDSHGGSATARSGFVRAAGPEPGEPHLDFSLPASGASTVVSGTGYYRIAWDEDVGRRIVDRTLVEQVGTPATAGDCGSVREWRTGRRFVPPGPVQAVDRLLRGSCYRYRISLAYGRDSSASISSGALYVSGAPPPCSYGDILATARAEAEWQRTVLDSTYRLPADYRPDDLVDSTAAGLNAGFLVRLLIVDDLAAMATAARGADAPFLLLSGYRSYASQVATYNAFVAREGIDGGLVSAARPGHSEHQLGTVLDFGSAGPLGTSSTDWGQSLAGAWLKANAWRFGFVLSYPAETTRVSCYKYEPWHYRYVGRPMAAEVHGLGITLREYLWLHRGVATGD